MSAIAMERQRTENYLIGELKMRQARKNYANASNIGYIIGPI